MPMRSISCLLKQKNYKMHVYMQLTYKQIYTNKGALAYTQPNVYSFVIIHVLCILKYSLIRAHVCIYPT